MKKGLSLVIPARNTERFIQNSLEKYHNFLLEKFTDFEIITVFNDSWDKGAEICKQLSEKLPIKVIEIPQRGKGYALIRGFQEARFEIIGFMDADNPFDFNKISYMLDSLENYDVVIASKYRKGYARNQEFLIRRLISIGGGIISKILFNLNFSDTQAGAKFFKKQVWEKIKNNQDSQSGFLCRGFDFDIEFLYKIQKAKFKIGEFYIPIKPDEFSTFRLKYLPGMLKRIFIMRFFK